MALPFLAIPMVYWLAGGSAAAGATYLAYKKSSSPSKKERKNTSDTQETKSGKYDKDDLAKQKERVYDFVKAFYGEEKGHEFECIDNYDDLITRVKMLTDFEKPRTVKKANKNLARTRLKVRKLEDALRELEELGEE